MNCNCLIEIEEKVLTKFHENNPKFGRIESAKFKNKYLDMELDPVQTVIGIPLEIHYSPHNAVKIKKTELCMSIKYCPFCGMKINPEV